MSLHTRTLTRTELTGGVTPARLDAAQQVIAVQTRYALNGRGLAHAALAGAKLFEPLRHYPARDVMDASGQGQFYYHAHVREPVGDAARPAVDDHEHGHFHLFSNAVRGEAPRHLVALSLDATGWPLRWFCTNRWVTGGDWTDAALTLASLRRYQPVALGRMAPVARWLGAMVKLYDEDLEHLLRQRDQALCHHCRGRAAEDVFENRRLDLLASYSVSLRQRLQALADAAPH